MKQVVLFLLCFAAFSVHAQTILKTDTNSVRIGKYWYQKGTLHLAQINDSTTAVLDNANAILVSDQKYNLYLNGNNGNTPFANKDSLNAFIRRNFFVDASNGGGGAVGGDLQTVTNEGNTTDNAIMSTGAGNFPTGKSGALVTGNAGSAFIGGYFNDTVLNGAIFYNEYTWMIGNSFYNRLYSTSGGIFGVMKGDDFARFKAAKAVDTNDVVTLGQVQTLPDLYTGWGAYQDTVYSQSSPFILASGAKRTLPNRAQLKIESQKPIDVTTFYRASDSTITGRSGDGLNIYVEFVAVPDGSTTYLQTSVDIGGVIGELYNQVFTFPNGASVPQRVSFSFSGYTLDTWQANGAKVKVMSDGQCNLYGMRYVLTRTHKAR